MTNGSRLPGLGPGWLRRPGRPDSVTVTAPARSSAGGRPRDPRVPGPHRDWQRPPGVAIFKLSPMNWNLQSVGQLRGGLGEWSRASGQTVPSPGTGLPQNQIPLGLAPGNKILTARNRQKNAVLIHNISRVWTPATNRRTRRCSIRPLRSQPTGLVRK